MIKLKQTMSAIKENPNIFDDMYFLEYSFKQKSYHYGKANDSISTNLFNVLSDNDKADFIPIFIGTYEDVERMYKAITSKEYTERIKI